MAAAGGSAQPAGVSSSTQVDEDEEEPVPSPFGCPPAGPDDVESAATGPGPEPGDFVWPAWVHRTWAWLSRLEVDEPDPSLPREERLYRIWWLQRNLPVARGLGWVIAALGTAVLPIYPLLFLILLPKYTIAELLPQYLILWLTFVVFTTYMQARTRWSLRAISLLSAANMVICSCCFVLAGFTRVGQDALSAPATYEDDDPAPYVGGLAILSWAGAGAFPMSPSAAFFAPIVAPYAVPAVWLIANGAWQQPAARFFKVALLHAMLLIQMATLCLWNVLQREATGRAHFSETRALRAEQKRLDRVMSLLLPPTLIAVMREDRRHGEGKKGVVAGDAAVAGGSNNGDTPQSGARGGRSGSGSRGRGVARFAEKFPEASVLFAEIAQSDEHLRLSPEARLLMLDNIFLLFDDLVRQTAGALKIETVSGVYVVAANVANVSAPNHTEVLSRLALKFVAATPGIKERYFGDGGGSGGDAKGSDGKGGPAGGTHDAFELRIGINSGPLIGGVIGTLLPRYRIMGDTVNTAARMQTTSLPGRVQLSPSAAGLLRAALPTDLGLEPRGEIPVKGKGLMSTFFLVDLNAALSTVSLGTSAGSVGGASGGSFTIGDPRRGSDSDSRGALATGVRGLVGQLAEPSRRWALLSDLRATAGGPAGPASAAAPGRRRPVKLPPLRAAGTLGSGPQLLRQRSSMGRILPVAGSTAERHTSSSDLTEIAASSSTGALQASVHNRPLVPATAAQLGTLPESSPPVGGREGAHGGLSHGRGAVLNESSATEAEAAPVGSGPAPASAAAGASAPHLEAEAPTGAGPKMHLTLAADDAGAQADDDWAELEEEAAGVIGPAYFRRRFAALWLQSRLRGVYEPLSTAAVCIWLAYAVGDVWKQFATEAAIIGAILAASFLHAALSLAAGLLLGGRWRSLPDGASWVWQQKLELLPTLLHAMCLSQWARLIGRELSTPVWSLLYEMGFAASILHVLDPPHALALQLLILGQHCAVLGWEATHDPLWASPAHGGSLRWLEYVYTIVLEIVSVDVLVLFVGATQIEWMRRADARLSSRATLQRNDTARLVSNFLPLPVMLAMHERAGEDGEEDDIVAWAFDPACILQSDIVGFTALSSRISPEALCGFLHDLFSRFDELAARFGVNKIGPQVPAA